MFDFLLFCLFTHHHLRNTSSLQKNISVILKNVEKKCAGKGIMWIACPNVAKDGKPVGYL